MDNRSKNGVRNVISSILNKIIEVIFPFVTRTVIVYTIGNEYLGLSNLFTSVLMILNLSELGFGSALVYSMYKPVAEQDVSKICSLLELYRKIYYSIGISILAIGTLLSFGLPYLIKGGWPSDINIYVLFFIYLLNTSISYFAFAHKKALLMAYQRNDIISNINSIVISITYTLQIGILLLTHNYYLYVIVFIVSTLADNLVANAITNKKYPKLVCKGVVDAEMKQSIIKHVKGIAIQKVASTARGSLSSIAISIYMGLTAITIYGNYYYIMTAIHTFLYQIPSSIRSTVGNSVASESEEKNYRDFCSLTLLYAWITGICACCLLNLYQPFMYLWMGQELMLPFVSVFLFCVYFLMLQLGDIINLYKDATGLWWEGRYRVSVEAISNAILCFLLGKIWGINGILLAPIITLALLDISYGGFIVFKYYFVNENFYKMLKTIVFYLIMILLSLLLSNCVCTLYNGSVVCNIIFRILVSLTLPNIVYFILLFKTDNYKTAKIFAIGIISTFKK